MNLIAYPAFKNRATNPYQALLYTELQQLGWRVDELRMGLRPDIVHLHWPDGFAFHRSLGKTLLRATLLLGLLSYWRGRGAKVVWTVHNLRSHEGFHPRVEAWFWQRLYRRLDGIVALNRFTIEAVQSMPLLRQLPHAVIRHGLYLRLGGANGGEGGEVLSRRHEAHGATKPLKLLLFGKLRPYKELPLLLEAFEQWGDADVELTVAGQVHDAALAEYLERQAKEIPRLRLIARFLEDAELHELLEASDAVVIPYAGSLNSGVVFLALAYGKPVIAPATPGFMEIAEDFGEERVRLFDPPLDAGKLAACSLTRKSLATGPEGSRSRQTLAAAESTGQTLTSSATEAATDAPPDAYTWPLIARQHGEFFERLVGGK